MREWFHPNGALKEIYRRCVNFCIYFAKYAERYPILESNQILKDKICVIFRNQINACRSLYVVCIQLLIKATIQEKTLISIECTHKTTFSVLYPWTNNFVRLI